MSTKETVYYDNEEMGTAHHVKFDKSVRNSIKNLLLWIVAGLMTALAVALGLTATAMYFNVNKISVVGASMEDSLHNGDTTFIWTLEEAPQRNDLVIFEAPDTWTGIDDVMEQNGTITFIKRAIAVPGDKVQITDTEVLVNDVKVVDNPFECKKDSGSYTLQEKEYFLLGDNTGASNDALMQYCFQYNAGIEHIVVPEDNINVFGQDFFTLKSIRGIE